MITNKQTQFRILFITLVWIVELSLCNLKDFSIENIITRFATLVGIKMNVRDPYVIDKKQIYTATRSFALQISRDSIHLTVYYIS